MKGKSQDLPTNPSIPVCPMTHHKPSEGEKVGFTFELSDPF